MFYNSPLVNPPICLTHNSQMTVESLRTRRAILQIGLKIKHGEIYPAWPGGHLVPAPSNSYLVAAHRGEAVRVPFAELSCLAPRWNVICSVNRCISFLLEEGGGQREKLGSLISPPFLFSMIVIAVYISFFENSIICKNGLYPTPSNALLSADMLF